MVSDVKRRCGKTRTRNVEKGKIVFPRRFFVTGVGSDYFAYLDLLPNSASMGGF